MESATVRIKKGAGRSLKSGGSWIYDNEIDTISKKTENGDMVRVEDFDGYPLGQGFINLNSTIAIRMMTRKKMWLLMKNGLSRGYGKHGRIGSQL